MTGVLYIFFYHFCSLAIQQGTLVYLSLSFLAANEVLVPVLLAAWRVFSRTQICPTWVQNHLEALKDCPRSENILKRLQKTTLGNILQNKQLRRDKSRGAI